MEKKSVGSVLSTLTLIFSVVSLFFDNNSIFSYVFWGLGLLSLGIYLIHIFARWSELYTWDYVQKWNLALRKEIVDERSPLLQKHYDLLALHWSDTRKAISKIEKKLEGLDREDEQIGNGTHPSLGVADALELKSLVHTRRGKNIEILEDLKRLLKLKTLVKALTVSAYDIQDRFDAAESWVDSDTKHYRSKLEEAERIFGYRVRPSFFQDWKEGDSNES